MMCLLILSTVSVTRVLLFPCLLSLLLFFFFNIFIFLFHIGSIFDCLSSSFNILSSFFHLHHPLDQLHSSPSFVYYPSLLHLLRSLYYRFCSFCYVCYTFSSLGSSFSYNITTREGLLRKNIVAVSFFHCAIHPYF